MCVGGFSLLEPPPVAVEDAFLVGVGLRFTGFPAVFKEAATALPPALVNDLLATASLSLLDPSAWLLDLTVAAVRTPFPGGIFVVLVAIALVAVGFLCDVGLIRSVDVVVLLLLSDELSDDALVEHSVVEDMFSFPCCDSAHTLLKQRT